MRILALLQTKLRVHLKPFKNKHAVHADVKLHPFKLTDSDCIRLSAAELQCQQRH